MRIHHHVSIILFIAIAGAIGLALAVGLFLGGVETAARDAGTATEQYKQVEEIASAGRALRDAAGLLGADAPEEAFRILHRTLDQSIAKLAVLRQTSLIEDTSIVSGGLETLARMGDLSAQLAAARAQGNIDEPLLLELQEATEVYLTKLETLGGAAAAAAASRDLILSRQRKVVMLTIGLICILYLGVIERVRLWTTRRLIHPIQRLAQAALQAMEGEEVVTGMEQGTTEELNTLARVLSSFVDTLKARVRERTAQVEQQKERLEREVAVRRRAEDQLRHAAFHDKLTGLCNRDLLLDRLERCIERARRHEDYRFAVLFLDIDRFKEVNDSLGHFVGDQLLISIADRLQQCLRSGDSVTRVDSNTVARIGGDEFVVLLDGIRDRAEASLVAERVQDALAAPFRLHGHEVFTTASIGIAFNEIECEKADNLLRDADTAMYYAKAAGKARHEVFNKRMHHQAMARLRLGNDLRRAVENEEFDLAYQPIINLRTGRLEGFEALARWKHPQRGLVPPAEFIARAEETGLIVQLGGWVLGEACRQLRTWCDQSGRDAGITMSVNVSKRQVGEPGLVDHVREVLRETGLQGHHLRLEITESVIMENLDSITEVLEQLKRLGVEIHMDDFGTGYSSLSYLHRFPLDVLKIDRAFTTTMSRNNDYSGIVHTVVALAHTLNMRVTVEGVETREQLDQLMALQCDAAQGFFFSEPLPATDAVKLVIAEPDWLRKAA